MSVVENARNQLVFRDFDGAIVVGDKPSVSGSIRVAGLETFD
jgi:hypothetical protein